MHSNGIPRHIAASFLALLLAAGHGCAREQAKLGSDEARELLELSRISPQFDVTHEILTAQIAPLQATLSPEQFGVVTRSIEERLAAENLTPKILERLEAEPDSPFTDTVIEWLRTPETGQVHAAAGTSNADIIAEFKDFMAKESQRPLSEERRALIGRYDLAARCSSDSIAALRLAIYAASLISNSLQPTESRSGAEAAWELAEQRSRLLEPVFEEVSVVTLRFAFRGLSDADVASFVERSESEPMQWYYTTLSNAFRGALEEVSNDIGATFATTPESPPDA